MWCTLHVHQVGVCALLKVSIFRVPTFVVCTCALLGSIYQSPQQLVCACYMHCVNDNRVISEHCIKLHLARFLIPVEPSVCLAMMKVLVSSALRLTIWSTRSEIRGLSITMVHFAPFQCTLIDTYA